MCWDESPERPGRRQAIAQFAWNDNDCRKHGKEDPDRLGQVQQLMVVVQNRNDSSLGFGPMHWANALGQLNQLKY